jgi:glycine/D-amino acid oxidase-like deaminating enzyme
LIGQEIDLHQVGYLFLLGSRMAVTAFEANVALQNHLGVPSRMISVAEAQRMSPLIPPEGLLAAAYSPTDGHCTPESVLLGYASAARRAGATDTVEGFLYATGFSGHGFLMGPAVGEAVRDLYLGEETFVDVSGLSAGRFAAADVRPGAAPDSPVPTRRSELPRRW